LIKGQPLEKIKDILSKGTKSEGEKGTTAGSGAGAGPAITTAAKAEEKKS